MVRKGFLLIFTLLTSYCSLLGQEVLTLDRAIDIAIERNYNVRIAANNTDRAGVQNTIGNAGFLPTLSASGSVRKSIGKVTQSSVVGDTTIAGANSSSESVSLSLQQTLFDGFSMFRTYEKQGVNEDFQDLRKQEEIENVMTQVITSYYDVTRAWKAVELTQQSLKLTGERYLLVKERRKSGAASIIEVLNTEVSMATDSAALLDQIRTLETGKNYLGYLMGGEDLSEYTFDLEVVTEAPLVEDLKAGSIENNVLMRQSALNITLTDLDYQIYQSARLPQLFGNVDFSKSGNASDFGFTDKTVNETWSFGLTARWSIFEGFRRNIQAQSIQVDRYNQEIAAEEVKMRLNRDFRDAVVSYEIALDQANFEARNLEIFEKSYTVNKQLYEAGRVSFLEMRDAQLSYIQSQNRLFNAKLDAKLQEVELLRLSGRLVKFRR